MSDDRKKSPWPWMAALLIGLPVLYVASFGPACWIVNREIVPDGSSRAIYLLYSPLIDCAVHGEHPGAKGLIWWVQLGCSEERSALFTLFDLIDEPEPPARFPAVY